MTHATNHDLLRYLDNTREDREAVTEHLRGCASCTARLERLRSFTTRLNDADAWEQPTTVPSTRLVEGLAALEARLANEERLANDLLPQLRDATNTATVPAAWLTAGVVRTLLRIVTRERDETPQSALTLARLARRVANTIPATAYPSPIVVQLQGQAWKEEANLLRHTGEYQAALDALDHAGQCFAAHPTGEYDLALVALVRALTLSHGMGRPSEAIPLLRQATTVFQSYGDTRRSAHARLAEGACAFDLGDFETARAIFESLLPIARTNADRETTARLIANIACCNLELEHLELATRGFEQAMRINEELGLVAEVVRSRWGLARLHAKRQQYSMAITQLGSVEAAFTTLGLHGEAGLVLLDVVESLLVLGRHEEIRAHLNGLVEHFTRAGATKSAMTALAYLQATILEDRVARRDVQAVRSWLERPHDQAAVFQLPHS
jgi:tetratricopeptide (TPR) repeat protein